MTEQEMWEAVQRSDASYDGLFFYAVKTTGIFCRPSCKSKPPKRENLCYFASGAEARAAGFRPCKRCRSDLLEYQPMREIAAEIKARLDKAASLDDVGLTPRRMTDIFKQEYKDIAEAIGHPKAFRAVGMANHANPIFIAIPCHRVIGASGSLVGYGGRLEMKKALLELERSNRG